MEPAPASPAPLRVFCSYARADEHLLDELCVHLAPLQRAGRVEVWDDRRVAAGRETRDEVARQLDQADLIVLLLSPDFFASDSCYGVEARRALERHDRGEALVVPVLVRPAYLEQLPIARLQQLPRDLRAVTASPDHDPAWLDVVRGIQEAIDLLVRSRGEGSRPAPASSRRVDHPVLVPPITNRFYPIREDILAELHARFFGDPGAPFPRVQCLCGFGGVGKTHTALHYASRHGDQYSGVFFVRAGSEISLRQGFFDIARAVATQPPHGDPLDIDAAVREATAWLRRSPVWLLILDHVEEPELAARFLPEGARGHVIVTSQKGDVQALNVVRPLYIGGLSAEDAMSFWRARTGRPLDDPAEREAAEKLAEELGRVPLALEQAAAYISTMSVPFAVHLRTLRNHPREVLAKYKTVFGEHRVSVAGVWDISLSRVERESPASIELLDLSAFLHGERIPLSLFCRDDQILAEVVAELGPTLAAALRDLESVYEILQPLSAYSLIFRAPGADWYGVNSMLQKAVRIRMGAEAERLWIERVVRAVERAVRPLEDQDWPRYRLLIPQIKAVIDLVIERDLRIPEAGRLLDRGAIYAHEQARYAQAEDLYQRALVIFRAQPAPDDLDLAQSLNGLGRIRFRRGRYAEAEGYLGEALALRRGRLPSTHPDIATSLNNLALLRFSSGSHAAEVDAMLREALSLRERALGSKHPLVAKTLNNLGLVRGAAGDLDAAEQLHRRALSIRSEILGPDHPDVAQSLNGLASALAGRGLHGEAEKSYRDALRIAERALGPEHSDLAFSHSGLGRLRSLEGKDDEALAFHAAALAIRERALGPDHPYVARSLREIALIHDRRGHLREAEPLYRRALSIWRGSLDPSHPDLVSCEARLARLSHDALASSGSPLP